MFFDEIIVSKSVHLERGGELDKLPALLQVGLPAPIDDLPERGRGALRLLEPQPLADQHLGDGTIEADW